VARVRRRRTYQLFTSALTPKTRWETQEIRPGEFGVGRGLRVYEDDVYGVAMQARERLLQRETEASNEVVQLYNQAWWKMAGDVDKLVQKMQDAETQWAKEHPEGEGFKVDESWLWEQGRLQETMDAMLKAVEEQNAAQEKAALNAQTDAVDMAEEDARRMAEHAMGPPPWFPFLGGDHEPPAQLPWNRPPLEAVETLMGYSGDGRPLGELFRSLAGRFAEDARMALIGGMAAGEGPAAVAPILKAALGGTMLQSLTIARTEMLRSYRLATLENYRANSGPDGVIDGWIWMASLTSHSCIVCVMMSGTWHGLDEVMDEHVNGRCAMAPSTKSWAEVLGGGADYSETAYEEAEAGYQEQMAEDAAGREAVVTQPPPQMDEGMPVSSSVPKGETAFLGLPEETQRAILGPGKLGLWQSGLLDLWDLVGQGHSDVWGPMKYERSLSELGWTQERIKQLGELPLAREVPVLSRDVEADLWGPVQGYAMPHEPTQGELLRMTPEQVEEWRQARRQAFADEVAAAEQRLLEGRLYVQQVERGQGPLTPEVEAANKRLRDDRLRQAGLSKSERDKAFEQEVADAEKRLRDARLRMRERGIQPSEGRPDLEPLGHGTFDLLEAATRERLGEYVVPQWRNVAEAQKWLAEKYPATTFDFGAADVRGVRAIADQFVHLAEAFPEVAKTIGFVGAHDSALALAADYRLASPVSYASTGQVDQRGSARYVVFNGALLRSLDYFAERLAMEDASGWLGAGTGNLEGLMSHMSRGSRS
jgi:hypothetical protein